MVGTDLSPIQPSWIPANLAFEVDDVEAPWTRAPGSVDYIHMRDLGRAIDDWPALLGQCLAALRPGGLVEITDTTAAHAPAGEVGREFAALLGAGYARRRRAIAHDFPALLTAAGFVGLAERLARLPVGVWPLQPQLKELGRQWRDCLVAGLEGQALAVLTRELGWSKAEVDVLVANMRRELLARQAMRVTRICSWVARKPL